MSSLAGGLVFHRSRSGGSVANKNDTPPALTTLNDKDVRQARVDEIRRMMTRRSSGKTRLTEFGDISATASRKTLLGN